MTELDHGVDHAFDPHDAAAAYVVDALDDAERAAFEAHLADCPSCEAEVAELGETLAELGAAYEQEAPAALRASVLNAIADVPQLPAEPSVGADRTAPAELPVPARPAGPRHAGAEVVSLADARARRASRVLAFAVAVALVVALALGGWVVRLNGQLDQQRQVADAQAQADTQLLSAPDARIYAVDRQDNGAKVSYVVSKDLNRAQLVGTDVPAPPTGKTYQLWTISGPTDNQTITSAGTFASSGRVRVDLTGDGVASAAVLAMSVEPSNGGRGSAQPTGTTIFAKQPIS